MVGRVLVLVTILILAQTGSLNSHQESGEWSCDSKADIHIEAEFKPGRITLDGQVDDWKEIDGSAFSLLPALDPHSDKAYYGGKMTLKASHDGKEIFFMLQVEGDYTYSEGYNDKAASVAIMFQIGENASYHRMGGCEEGRDTCTNKTCKGHEVDLMHFSIGKAIPGRLYGGNPVDNSEGNGGDRFGHLVDLYGWNPHCRYLDGIGPSANDSSAQNDWKGTWWHSSLTHHSGFVKDDSPYSSSNQSGAYYFEFSRPLRTMDRLQQDAQFTIGRASKMSVAFWYPVDGKPWHGSGHFSISCHWIPLNILPDGSELTDVPKRSPWDTATAFSLLFSVVAFGISIFVGHRVSRTKNIAFTQMDNL
ncbi:PREDICTED: uncharacterized protein LOC109228375 [Nicotiana attenuata]|uniref:Cytochrome c-552/DMSO reductase-like haem-binding domain-containing protein n=1 Tax=Nicotiana attenuata TaxID=49451 RepID=A0A1J6JBT9_NICAT|nr:PREDICTED: uncharacterized protein LOC109228375 [Nicotiana attenuata]OIT08299.1 hypothetical protein A4A49_09609 [Nicotiana attenuata]